MTDQPNNKDIPAAPVRKVEKITIRYKEYEWQVLAHSYDYLKKYWPMMLPELKEVIFPDAPYI